MWSRRPSIEGPTLPLEPAACWAEQLVCSPCFDPQADQFVRLAELLDRIYGH